MNHFSATDRKIHNALLEAAKLVDASARAGVDPVIRKQHVATYTALCNLTKALRDLGYVEPTPTRRRQRA